MIKNIMVCVDGSECSDRAVQCGIYLAGLLKARISGLHVLDSRTMEGPLLADISGWIGAQPYSAQLNQFRELMQEKGKAILSAYAEACAEAKLETGTELVIGHPASVIQEREAHTELVVLGQKGVHADWLAGFMGSTADRIVRHGEKPCLIVNQIFEPFSGVLVAYDGSAHAADALVQAAEISVETGLPLTLLTVREGHAAEKAEEILQQGVELAESHNASPRPIMAEGDEHEAILETARREGCNLIILGAHGHSRWHELILGSTTTMVVNHSEVPVMVVR